MTTALLEGGVVLTATSAERSEEEKLRGLGLFGFMALGHHSTGRIISRLHAGRIRTLTRTVRMRRLKNGHRDTETQSSRDH